MTFIPFFSDFAYALPLIVLFVAAALWWWRVRISAPPRLAASPAFHSWRVNPVAAAYESLRQERYLLAAYLLRERLAEEARERFGVEPSRLVAWSVGPEVPSLPEPLTYRRVLRDLRTAYKTAYLAEAARPSDVLASYLAPMRRRRAAREFGKAASEVEQVLAVWGTTP